MVKEEDEKSVVVEFPDILSVITAMKHLSMESQYMVSISYNYHPWVSPV